jgi:prolyl-tRNA editing enzyme YbaK/EbsC (Cys-tRNA(Pro) deacylase)/uncharacterized protein with PIN domain
MKRTAGVSASAAMSAAMSSLQRRGPTTLREDDSEKAHPSPFALPPDVLEQLKAETGMASQSSAAILADYLARGHMNTGKPAVRDGPKQVFKESAELLGLQANLKDRSIKILISAGRLDVACAYCGTDTSMQLLLVRSLLARADFAGAAACLKALLLQHHPEAVLDDTASDDEPPVHAVAASELTAALASNSPSAIAVSARTSGLVKDAAATGERLNNLQGTVMPAGVAGLLSGGASAAAVGLPFAKDSGALAPVPTVDASAQARSVDVDFKLGGELSLADVQDLARSSCAMDGGAGGAVGGRGRGLVTGGNSALGLASGEPAWQVPLGVVVEAAAEGAGAAAALVDFSALPPQSRLQVAPSTGLPLSSPLLSRSSSNQSASSRASKRGGDRARRTPVRVVDSAAGLAAMRDAIEAQRERLLAANAVREPAMPPPAAHGPHSLRSLFVVGVDAEWRPEGKHESPLPPPVGAAPAGSTPAKWPVSLLQVSTPLTVFLVDMLALHAAHAADPSGTAAAVHASLGWLLQSPRVLKLGFGLKGDLQRLASTYPHFSAAFAHAASVLELPHVLSAIAAFWEPSTLAPAAAAPVSGRSPVLAAAAAPGGDTSAGHLLDAPLAGAREVAPKAVLQEAAAHSHANRRPFLPLWLLHIASLRGGPKHSLSGLVESVLGSPLSKAHQTSDWQRRPLSLQQLEYAALDALALVHALQAALHSTFDAAAAHAASQGSKQRTEKCPVGGATAVQRAASVDWSGGGDDWVVEEVVRSAATDISLEGLPEAAHVHSSAGAGHAGFDYRPFLHLEAARSAAAASTTTATNPAAAQKHADASPSTSPAAATPSTEGPEPAAAAAAEDVPALTPDTVREALAAAGFDPDWHLVPVPPSGTAHDGAVALGVPRSRVVKTLSFFVDGKPLIALLRGDQKADWRRLAAVAGSARLRIRMADAGECVRVFGYRPGSFPPFGHRQQFPTYIDASIREALADGFAAGPGAEVAEGAPVNRSLLATAEGEPLLYAGGGSAEMKLKLTWRQLLAGSQGAVAEFAAAPAAVPAAAEGAGTGAGASPTATAGAAGAGPGAESGSAAAAAAAVAAALDVSSVPPVDIAKPRFLIDGMLGRLTRWLRVIGCDAESTVGPGASAFLEAYEARMGKGGKGKKNATQATGASSASSGGHANGSAAADGGSASGEGSAAAEGDETAPEDGGPDADPDAPPLYKPAEPAERPKGVSRAAMASRALSVPAIISWVNESGRIFVTRDRKIAQRREPCCIFWMPVNETTAQFELLTEHFGLTVRPEDLMSRCARCNTLGYTHLTPEQAGIVDPGIPAKVLHVVKDFWKCRGCGKVYWWVRV